MILLPSAPLTQVARVPAIPLVPPPICIYDANILFGMQVRNLVIQLAVNGIVAARWSDDINREWACHVTMRYPNVTPAKAAQTIALMNRHVPSGNVTGYQHLIPTLNLPDPNDRHVLAAAIVCQANLILTSDRKGFPKATLARYGIVPIRLDTFLCGIFNTNPALVLDAVKAARQNLTRSQPGPESFIQMLGRSGILKTFCSLLQLNRAHI